MMNQNTPNPDGADAPQELGPEEMNEIDEAFAKADKYIPHEMPSYQRNMTDAIDRLTVDSDFDSTMRDLLIAFEDEGFDLKSFLADQHSWGKWGHARFGDQWSKPRYLDLIRAHRMLEYMAQPGSYMRDELSRLYMRHSLCPIHHVDWAICFDDDDESCAQIRACFPNEHDT
jgi:hypothetical protein